MSEVLKEYFGFLTFDEVDQESLDYAQAMIREAGLDWDMGAGYLEVDYSGKDTNCFVVALLLRLAPIVGSSPGEVRCTEARDDEKDPSFFFYHIEGSRLLRQEGRIVRGDSIEVELS